MIKANQKAKGSHLNDEPIFNSVQDRIGYKVYTRVLAKRILETTKPPVTVGIYGDWGSGKSSLLYLLKEELEREKPGLSPPIFINVWQLNSREEVWKAFVQALFQKVQNQVPFYKRIKWKEARKQIWLNLLRIAVVIFPVGAAVLFAGETTVINKHINPLAGNFYWLQGGTFAAWLILGKRLIESTWESILQVWHFDINKAIVGGTFQTQISELTNLCSKFEEMVTTLIENNGPLFIFIDDLDRCNPEIIPEVLEALKLFTTSKSCVYVLALDYRIVRKGIQKKYDLKNDQEAGHYLEKIVQIPFQMPFLSRPTVYKFLNNLNKELPKEVCNVFVEGQEANPRVLKRCIQVYLTWHDLETEFKGRWEIDPLDNELVAKWLTIQMRYRALYEILRDHKDYLLWLERWALRLAGEEGKLNEKDRQLVQFFPDEVDDQISYKPSFESSVEEVEFRNLLTFGDTRFNERIHKNALDSYIFLGGTSGDLATGDNIRAKSRERTMLLSPRPEERQKIVNQLLAWTPVSQDKKSLDTLAKEYRDRIDSAEKKQNEQKEAIFLADEIKHVNEAKNALSEGEVLEFERTGTLRIPGHVLEFGTPAPELKTAIEEGLDPRVAKLESCQHQVFVPTFRIARFPVSNEKYREFLEDISRPEFRRQFPSGIPYDIVEYEAYCEPCCEGKAYYKSVDEVFSFSARKNCQGVPTDDKTLRLVLNNMKNKPSKAYLSIERKDGAFFLKVAGSLDSLATCNIKSLSYGLKESRSFRVGGMIILVNTYTDYDSEYNWENEKTHDQKYVPFHIRAWRDDQVVQLYSIEEQFKRWIKIKEISNYPITRDSHLERFKLWIEKEGKAQYPVTNISWEGAVAYCIWLRLQTKRPYRLPREPEWEAACAADGLKKTPYPWGEQWSTGLTNTEERKLGTTTQNGAHSPDGDSGYAIADLVGNAYEWCADNFGELNESMGSGLLWDDIRFRVEPAEFLQVKERAIRGGSFREKRGWARSSCRRGFDSKASAADIGFRVVIATAFDQLCEEL